MSSRKSLSEMGYTTSQPKFKVGDKINTTKPVLVNGEICREPVVGVVTSIRDFLGGKHPKGLFNWTYGVDVAGVDQPYNESQIEKLIIS